MALTILSDNDVKALLGRLQCSDVHAIMSTFSAALQAYSTGEESKYPCHRQTITRPGGPTMLFMPATLPAASSVKVVGVPPAPAPAAPAASAAPAAPIQGAILVFDAAGRATGLVNAAETTAFRTALGSMLLYAHRRETRHIVVFGAGKQALWHVRLALVLKRAEIETVTVVNRSVARAQELVARLQELDAGEEGGGAVKFSVLAGAAGAREQQQEEEEVKALKEAVARANVVFCTTPSKSTLFPAEWLAASAEDKTRFISAIGSYQLDMQELDPALLQSVVARDGPGSYYPVGLAQHQGITSGSIIVVDSRQGCAAEAGELVKAGIEEARIVEVGELSHVLHNGREEEHARLKEWLARGNVVYKSVGMGIMDLSICQALLERAAAHGIGTRLDEF
ncbi:hypothetical protein BD289DRAFT_43748 [Coniella lustricola]|uniref:Ornithine cyclodeaminase n=1 Tax=Coniella lustricola TaxID=2025994 RepID=A0A2T3A1U6_9PEZI|nr:hypothetical protein BD289DRAFT_43748 [Coniella lustricola]